MIKTVSKFIPKKRFNHDIIIDQKVNDSMVDYLDDVCKALESIEYIKYNGYELIKDENKFPKKQHILPIKDSRLQLAIFHFTITKDERVEHISMPLYLPKLINNYYFILNGTKYYPIFQTIDSATYNTGNCVVLKSLLMPIIIKNKKDRFTASNGTSIIGKIFYLTLFKRDINIFWYFFAEAGISETLDYFDMLDKVKIVNRARIKNKRVLEDPDSEELYFKIARAYYLVVNREDLENSIVFTNYIVNLLDIFSSKKVALDRLDDIEYCMSKLGSFFTTNTALQVEKCKTILVSIRRLLDDRTKKVLQIDRKDKRNIFALIRWITRNYERLKNLNNFSLDNKRLRLSEYMVAPFVRYLSGRTYKLLNTKVNDIEKVKGIFKINPMFIISDLQTSELLRYCNTVNDCDLFNSGLKWSGRGPQALGEGNKKTVSMYYRGIHPSQMGRLSLNTCSASDPGLTGCLSPFVEMKNGLYFSETGYEQEEKN